MLQVIQQSMQPGNNEVVNVNSVNVGSIPPLSSLLLSYTLKFKWKNTTNFATPFANMHHFTILIGPL